MTPAEFTDMLYWLQHRWANLPWTAEETEALRTDLADVDHEAAMIGCRHLYAQGLEYPPNTSQVYAAARNAAISERRYRPALPEPAAERASAEFVRSLPWPWKDTT